MAVCHCAQLGFIFETRREIGVKCPSKGCCMLPALISVVPDIWVDGQRKIFSDLWEESTGVWYTVCA